MQHVLKESGLVFLHSSNYNRWQYDQLQKYVGKSVLEIGCGLGNLTQYLIHDTHYLVSIDIKKEAVDFTRTRFRKNKKLHVECRDVFTAGLGKYSHIRFDTIVLSNVLEHIPDDRKALELCYTILKQSKGKLLLIVPAHKMLFGSIDHEVGHFRRYGKNELIQLAQKTHFKIIDLYAFNFIGAIAWFMQYCVLRKKNTNNSTNSFEFGIFEKYFAKPSKFIESIFRPVVGLSYVAILQAE
jgi:2-polyprenyl-3-methyl-5-hydroxy-6-metoxy-1,4-benzoquinol methylase